MKKIALTLSFALASLLGASAFAQGSGAVGGKGKPTAGDDAAMVTQPATKQERTESRKTRKTQGKQIAKSGENQMGEAKPTNAATGPKVAKDDRKTAKTQRRAEGKEAQKTTERGLN